MSTVPLSQAKTHLARLLAEVEAVGEPVVITRSGRPAGVLVSVSEYEGLLETLEVLADRELSQAIERGLAEATAGELLGHDEVWDGLDTSVPD